DAVAPVLVGLPSATATADCDNLPAVPTVTATDNCDSDVPVTYEEVIDVTDGCGTITRTWTAEDACGNEVTFEQVITVTDAVAPVLVGLPSATATAECENLLPARTVTATDIWDNDVPVTYEEVIDLTDCDGTLTRTWH